MAFMIKIYCRGKKLNGTLLSESKIKKRMGLGMNSKLRGQSECLLASVLRIFLAVKYVAPHATFFNRDALICLLNLRLPSWAVHVQRTRETAPTWPSLDRFSADENTSGNGELILPWESQSVEAAAAGAESLQEGAAHLYSSDISRTLR